ncbi:hypothetical protein P4U97_19165 [Bacillus swezeyi]|uniref:hypothetical protein n=1 Tax=Bacillus swezeyi TaxID=1925020 RepID=UPI002E21A42E|nr:hypothetical protein [Bacillus swezeyi]
MEERISQSGITQRVGTSAMKGKERVLLRPIQPAILFIWLTCDHAVSTRRSAAASALS